MKCVAVGLPPGVPFRQPSLYKSPELTRIHNHLEKKSFSIYLTDCDETPGNVISIASEEPSQDS